MLLTEKLVQITESTKYQEARFQELMLQVVSEIHTTRNVTHVSFWSKQRRSFSSFDIPSPAGRGAYFLTKEQFPEIYSLLDTELQLDYHAYNSKFFGILNDLIPRSSVYGMAVIPIGIGKSIGSLLVGFNQECRFTLDDELKMFFVTLGMLLSERFEIDLLRKKIDRLDETKNVELPLAEFICDPLTFRILNINKMACTVTGYSDVELLQKRLIDFCFPREEGSEELKTWQDTFEIFRSLVWLVRADGEKLTAKFFYKNVQTEAGNQLLCLMVDMGQEAKLLSINENLNKKISEHTFFASHNLRAPIANILGLMDMVPLIWEDKEAYEELLQKIKIQTMILDETLHVLSSKLNF